MPDNAGTDALLCNDDPEFWFEIERLFGSAVGLAGIVDRRVPAIPWDEDRLLEGISVLTGTTSQCTITAVQIAIEDNPALATSSALALTHKAISARTIDSAAAQLHLIHQGQ
jgi:hypothetical protein